MARQAKTRLPGKYADKIKRAVACSICHVPTKNYTARRLENAKIIFIGKDCCGTN